MPTIPNIGLGGIVAAFDVGYAIGVEVGDEPPPRFNCEGGIVETPYAELATPDEPDGEWLSDMIVFNCGVERR